MAAELFADVYATYALGAGYPIAMLVLRAVPDQYADATDSHPSWRRRVLTVLGALEALAAMAGDPASAVALRLTAREGVLPVWRELGGDDLSSDDASQRARRQAAAMVELLVSHAPARLQYHTAGPVEGLLTILDAVAADPLRRPDDVVELPADAQIAHVLNAAWRWRLRHGRARPGDVERVSRAALRLGQLAEA